MSSMPLKLLVDGYALGDNSKARGIGTYLTHMLTGLLADPGFATSVLAVDEAELPASATRVRMRRRLSPRFAPLEHDLLLSRAIRSCQADVFWSPAQSPPRNCAVPWVQTLHDLTPLYFEHPLLEADARRWSRVGPRLRNAAAVIVPSDSTAEQAVTFLQLEPRRIHVVPSAADEQFHPVGPRTARATPYVLMVAAWGPHKGFEDAMEVIARVASAGLPHRLVIAGRQDAWMTMQITSTLGRARRPDLVDVLGYVEDLPALYRGAASVLIPSRAEGFGLPAVEAMRCGACVVGYAATSIPEVVADGGVLVEDGDIRALADALIDALRNESAAREIAARGIARAREFTWEKSVARHAEVLREASLH